MARASKRARRIVVDGAAYRWRVSVWNGETRDYAGRAWRRANLFFWPEDREPGGGRVSVASTAVGFIPGAPGFGIGSRIVRACVREALARGWEPGGGGEFRFDSGRWAFADESHLTPKTVSVFFGVFLGGPAINIEALTHDELFSRWVEDARVPTGIASFQVYADGELWCGVADDSLGMAETWPCAVLDILHGAPRATIYPQYETELHIVRHGELVELYEISGSSGRIIGPRVRVRLRELALELAAACEAAGRRIEALLADPRLERATTERRRKDITRTLRQRFRRHAAGLRGRARAATIPEPSPPEPPSAAAHAAVLANDLASLRAAALIDGVEQRHEDLTLLQHATELQREAMVAFLLDARADPNAAAPGTRPALTIAVHRQNLPIVRQLVQAGADIEHAADGVSTLMHAATRSREVFEYLRDAGARYTLPAAILAGDLARALGTIELPLHPEIAGFCAETMARCPPARRPDWRRLLARLAFAGADLEPALRIATGWSDAELLQDLRELGADPGDPRADDQPRE